MFFKKKSKFPDYVCLEDDTIYLRMFEKKSAKKIAKLTGQKIISLEEAFINDKPAICPTQWLPLDVMLYVKQNAKNKLVYDDYGHLIGYESYEELDEDYEN